MHACTSTRQGVQTRGRSVRDACMNSVREYSTRMSSGTRVHICTRKCKNPKHGCSGNLERDPCKQA